MTEHTYRKHLDTENFVIELASFCALSFALIVFFGWLDLSTAQFMARWPTFYRQFSLSGLACCLVVLLGLGSMKMTRHAFKRQLHASAPNSACNRY